MRSSGLEKEAMIRAGLVFAVLVGTLTVLTGCGNTPIREDLPRTPFGRYQALRGGEPPMEEEDTFGRTRPALRARLQPMDRP